MNVKRREHRKSLVNQMGNPCKRVDFHRSYRKGDLPDIEIPRTAIITPLKVLARVSKCLKFLDNSDTGN